MEVFRCNGEEGILTLLIDGKEPIQHKFTKKVSISVSYTNGRKTNSPIYSSNTDQEGATSDDVEIETEADCAENEPEEATPLERKPAVLSDSAKAMLGAGLLDKEVTVCLEKLAEVDKYVGKSCKMNNDKNSSVDESTLTRKGTRSCKSKATLKISKITKILNSTDTDDNRLRRNGGDDDDYDDDGNDTDDYSPENDYPSVTNVKKEIMDDEDYMKKSDNKPKKGTDSKLRIVNLIANESNILNKIYPISSMPTPKSKTSNVKALTPSTTGPKSSMDISKRHSIQGKPLLQTISGQKNLSKSPLKSPQFLYKCKLCNNTFTDSYKLSIHQRAANVKVRCSICKAICISKASLVLHQALKHGKGKGGGEKSCPICSKTCLNQTEILNHLRLKHTLEGFYQCCVCRSMYETYGQFRTHLSSHTTGHKHSQLRSLLENKSTPSLAQNDVKWPVFPTTDKRSITPASDKRSATPLSDKGSSTPVTVKRPTIPGADKRPITFVASTSSVSPTSAPNKFPRLSSPNVSDSSPTSRMARRKPLAPQHLMTIMKARSVALMKPGSHKPGRITPASSLASRNELLRKAYNRMMVRRKMAQPGKKLSPSLLPSGEKMWKCHFCERVFVTKGDYINHKKSYKTCAQCMECGFSAPSKALYLIHIYQKHTTKDHDRYIVGNQDLKCHICEEPVALDDVLNHIMISHTGESPYECCVCKKPAKSYEEWVQHGKTHMRSKEEKESINSKLVLLSTAKTEESVKNNTLFCQQCKKHFSDESACLRHHKVEKEHPCEICETLCFSEAGYQLHQYFTHTLASQEQKDTNSVVVKSNSDALSCWLEDDAKNITNTQMVECPTCKEKFEMCKLLSHVVKEHTKENLYQCCTCEALLPTIEDYIDHCNFHLGKKLIPRRSGYQRCSECGIGFENRIHLSKHRSWHTHKCPYCSVEEFTTKVLLEVHCKNNHLNEMLTCRSCPKLFYCKYALAEHERNHFFSKKSPCPDCGVMCANVRKHMLTRHPTGEASFSCSICHVKFTYVGLRAHIKTHRRNKYECDICKKTFRRLNALSRHAKTHLDNKPQFSCKICGKTCTQRTNLATHMRIHNSYKAYACEYCGQGFNYNQSLQQHIRKRHNEGGDAQSSSTKPVTRTKPQRVQTSGALSSINSFDPSTMKYGESTENDTAVTNIINTSNSNSSGHNITQQNSLQSFQQPGISVPPGLFMNSSGSVFPQTDSVQHYFQDNSNPSANSTSGYIPNNFARNYTDFIQTMVRSSSDQDGFQNIQPQQQQVSNAGYPHVFFSQF